MDKNELIAKMRARVALCRNLAQSSADERTAKTLNEMADEGERDISELLSQRLDPIIPLPRAES